MSGDQKQSNVISLINISNDSELCNKQHNTPTPPVKHVNNAESAEITTMSQQKDSEKKSVYDFYMIGVAQICVILYTIVIVYYCLTGEFFLFTWHPLFMTLGWFVLMTQGILVLSRGEYLTRHVSHKLRVKLHWIIQGIGAILTTVAFTIVAWNKIILNKHHFQSWHAIFGLAGLVCMALTLCTGASTLYSSALKSYYSPKWNKFVHVLLGVLTYVFGGFSLLLTVYTNWFKRKNDDSNFMFLYGMLCVLSVVILTLIKPVIYLWRRVSLLL